MLDPAAGLTQVLADGTNTYLYGNSRLAQYQAVMQYFGADGLGSVRQLYDASGMVLANSRYDPYGNLMAQSGTATSVFAFTGEQWDAATGLEYLRARYYSSAQGRFVTKDEWEGDYTAPLSLNKWNYAQPNPVVITDPSGRAGPLVLVGVILIGAGTAALIDEVNQVDNYAQKHNIGFWEAWNSPRLELDQSSMIDSGLKGGFLGCLTVEAVPALIGLGGLSFQQFAMWTNNPQVWQRGAQWLTISGKIDAALSGTKSWDPKWASGLRSFGGTTGRVVTFNNPSKLQREFDLHGSQFGVSGNYAANAATYRNVLTAHVSSPNTAAIQGTYRGTLPVIHYYNPGSSLNVMVDLNGNFVGAWKLSVDQVKYLMLNGAVK